MHGRYQFWIIIINCLILIASTASIHAFNIIRLYNILVLLYNKIIKFYKAHNSKNYALFLLYTESPLSSNPLLKQPNATSLHLMWSPPFLWPGYLIKSYNITVWSNSDESINSYQVNSTSFSNAVIAFPFSPQHQHCTNFTFGITPMHHQLANQTYYATGGYLSGE